MLLLLDIGVVNTRRHNLMIKYLMLMPLHTAVHRYLPFIDGLNGRNKGRMSNALERWRWALLPLLCFPHLVV